MKKVLITGGAGFIGSNLTASQLEKKNQVTVYDNLSRPKSIKNLQWLRSLKNKNLRIVRGDVENSNQLAAEVKKAAIIFHLAGQTAVTTSIKKPALDFRSNLLGSFNLLEAARKAGHRPIIVYSSTNKVYGQLQGKRKPVSEKQPLEFHSPYACSKGGADQYIQDYYRSFSLPTVVFRQSCIYGPHQFGNEDQGWVAHFIISALNRRPLTIYGDGQQVRDILEVSDLVRAFDLAVKKINQARGQVYNVGGGPANAISLLELIKILENELAERIKVSFARKRLGDQQYYVSNIDKIKKDLSWQPLISKEKGVRQLINWMKKNQIR